MLFALLAARDLWSGRRRGWWWAGAVLLCGDVAATYLLAIGVGLVLSGRRHVRGRRRYGHHVAVRPGTVGKKSWPGSRRGHAGSSRGRLAALDFQGPQAVLLVPAKTAAELASVERRIPSGAEVVVSQGVLGRFGGHQWVYPFLGSFPDGQTVPVRSRAVAFVFTDVGIEAATPAETAAAVKVVSGTLHARTIGAGNGVEAYLWQAPRRAATVSFPKLPSG